MGSEEAADFFSPAGSGAGWAGANIIRDLRNANDAHVSIAVDDDPAKAGTRINRVKVLYSTENIPEYVRRYNITEIIIAMPSANAEDKRRIINICTQTDCKLRFVPMLSEVVDGKQYTANTIAARAISKYGMALCYKCLQDYNAEAKVE